ncbi:MAG: hypothetical protein LBT04_02700, partial [Prevotellaceae bacterium]|nr:hypothetical protein [Prevotellaceae bacterium]
AKDEQEVEHHTKLAEYIKESIEQERTPKLFDTKQLADLSIESRLRQKEEEMPLMVNLRSLREERRIVTGFHDIYGDLFDNVGYNKVLDGFPVSQKVFRDITAGTFGKASHLTLTVEVRRI